MKMKNDGLTHIFRALAHRNFKLYFAGQGFSLIGTWMQAVAMGWFLYRVSGSAFLLGLAGFLSQFPSLILTPFAGVVSDRIDRKKILIVTQLLSMMQGVALAVFVLRG
ncbi:MAG TPA: MFS transporter, partial [Spirochaetota bacterium]